MFGEILYFMTQKLIFTNLALGFLSWFIPFIFSCMFFIPEGKLMISQELFKSIMIVTGILTGCVLLYQYYKQVDTDFVKQGIIVGCSWLFLNLILDVIVLIPLMKVSFIYYFKEIGLSYLAIPIISVAMGYLLRSKIKPTF